MGPAGAAVRAGQRQAPVVTTFHEYLDRKLAELEALSELFVIDTAGQVIAATRYVNYEGVEVLSTTVAIPGISWRYCSEVSVASAFGLLRSLALLAAALEAAFALVLVGIVWIVARSIVAPLRRLVGAAERTREGDLGVEVPIEGPDARHENDAVRISVSDTGEGIPDDQLEAIFRPFFTTKHRGTGLGLAITRGTVERRDGRLEVESEPGVGSTFTLVLSVPPGQQSAP